MLADIDNECEGLGCNRTDWIKEAVQEVLSSLRLMLMSVKNRLILGYTSITLLLLKENRLFLKKDLF